MKKQLTYILLLSMAGKLFAAAEAEQVAVQNNTNYAIDCQIYYGKNLSLAERTLEPSIKDNWLVPTAKDTISTIRFSVATYTGTQVHDATKEDLLKTRGSVLVTFEAGYTQFYTTISTLQPSEAKEVANLSKTAPARNQFYKEIGTDKQKQELITLGKKFNNALVRGGPSLRNNLTWQIEDPLKQLYGDSFYQTVLVRALLLYYYDIAHKLGHTFDQGTFVIYDPQGGIWDFFNNLEKKYARDASHFNALAQGNHALGEARPWLAQYGKNFSGLDVDIPEEQKLTLLFNRINKDGSSLFIKPEDHGTNTWTDFANHGLGFLQSQARKMSPETFGSDDDDAFSKEQVPVKLLRYYQALVQEAQQNGLNQSTANILLEQAKAEGIQAMLRGGNALLQYAPQQPRSFFNDLNAQEQSNNPHFTYLNKRFGRGNFNSGRI